MSLVQFHFITYGSPNLIVQSVVKKKLIVQRSHGLFPFNKKNEVNSQRVNALFPFNKKMKSVFRGSFGLLKPRHWPLTFGINNAILMKGSLFGIEWLPGEG